MVAVRDAVLLVVINLYRREREESAHAMVAIKSKKAHLHILRKIYTFSFQKKLNHSYRFQFGPLSAIKASMTRAHFKKVSRSTIYPNYLI